VKLALITGASGGIGAATARRLDADGWRLLLVARRAERLEALARSLREGGAHAAPIALDVTAPDAPERLRERVEEEGGLDLLVNNAGAVWRAAFGDPQGGYPNVRRTMELNLDAPVRLTEALLPVLRSSAPSSIVNVSSTAGRVGLPRSGAYSASKFALAGWTEALHLEERRNGVHVGLVLPGFVLTEGFPQEDLMRRRLTRWMVSRPHRVAEAIVQAGPGGRAERYVPRAYGLVPVGKALLPGVWRTVAERLRR
jgi:short-subunit dehydrogenase